MWHRVPHYELVDLLFLKNREHLCKSLNICIFKANICNSNLCFWRSLEQNILQMLNIFSKICPNLLDFSKIADLQAQDCENLRMYIFYKANICKIFCSRDPQNQWFEFAQMFAWKHLYSKICTKFHDYFSSKIADLQAHSYELCISAIFE